MGTVISAFSGPVAAVFLLAENRLLREALLRILSKKDDIHVVGAASFGPDIFEQIVSTRANVVVLDSVSPVPVGNTVQCRNSITLNPAIRVVMVAHGGRGGSFSACGTSRGLRLCTQRQLRQWRVSPGPFERLPQGKRFAQPVLSVALFHWVARHKPAILSLHLKTSLGLSRREQQLVGLIQQGLTNKGKWPHDRLNLSEQTVKNHVHRILRKVGAPDRLSIGEVCRNEGLRV